MANDIHKSIDEAFSGPGKDARVATVEDLVILEQRVEQLEQMVSSLRASLREFASGASEWGKR